MLALAFYAPFAVASPLVVRCSATAPFRDTYLSVRIDIVLPSKLDKRLAVEMPDGRHQVVPDTPQVGTGTVEVTEHLGDAENSHRDEFIVTRLPGPDNSLIGFYVVNSYVETIRADLWEEGKPFVYLDTYNNEVLRGSCE